MAKQTRPARKPRLTTPTDDTLPITVAPAAQPSGVQEISDGSMTVRIRGGALDGQAVNLDVLSAKLACEAVERKFKTTQEGWVATSEFLDEMAGAFKSQGVDGCTPTLAYQLWHAVTTKWIDLKKNMPV